MPPWTRTSAASSNSPPPPSTATRSPPGQWRKTGPSAPGPHSPVAAPPPSTPPAPTAVASPSPSSAPLSLRPPRRRRFLPPAPPLPRGPPPPPHRRRARPALPHLRPGPRPRPLERPRPVRGSSGPSLPRQKHRRRLAQRPRGDQRSAPPPAPPLPLPSSLARLLEQLNGPGRWLLRPPHLVQQPLALLGRPQRVDDSSLRSSVGFVPLFGLRAALRQTLEWLSHQRDDIHL